MVHVSLRAEEIPSRECVTWPKCSSLNLRFAYGQTGAGKTHTMRLGKEGELVEAC